EKVRRLGERRGRLIAENPLDLEDVERQILTGHLEGDELDVVVACRHPILSPKASTSRIGTRVPRRRATPEAQGSDSPCGTGRARGTESTSARSPTSSTRASGRPYSLPSTRTSR